MRLSVDVSIESMRRQTPDGLAWSMQDNVPTANTTAPVGSFPPRARCGALGGRPVPNPQRGLVTRWPRDGGGRSRPVFWPTSPLRPRGGHAWLSAAADAAFSDLGKIEEMLSWRTLGDLTSLKGLGRLLSRFHPPVSVGMPNHFGYRAGGASAGRGSERSNGQVVRR